MSQPTSPVLLNSSFSQLDYFAASSPSQTQTPIFTLSLTTSPTSSLSTPNLLLSTPERGRSPLRTPTDESPQVQVLSSPQSALGLGVRRDSSSARRSVQFEKSAVNWARPLRVVEEDPVISMRIFGASLQRSRRLNRSPAPSPSSSDDEPLTPSPVTPSSTNSDDNVHVPQRGWSVFSSAKGLGVSGVAEWDTDTPITPIRALSLEPLPDFAFEPLNIPSSSSLSSISTKKSSASTKSKSGLPRSISKPILIQPPSIHHIPNISTPISNSRILATSQSLNSFSSPSNLAELRNLRQAAVVLENEAKRPMRPSPSCGQIKDTQRERKIKRKAVPSIAESDIIDYYSTSSCSSITASTPSSSSCRSSSSPDSEIIDNVKQRRRNSSIDQILVPRQLPGMGEGMGSSIFNRHRQLYQNHLATRSVIEVSPSSIPSFDDDTPTPRLNNLNLNLNITIPPRTHSSSPSKCSQHDGPSSMLLEDSINLSSASSLLSSSDDQPITPTLTASQTEYFMSSVENAFRKLEFERAEIGQKVSSSKHKRGFSRFLGKKNSSSVGMSVKEE
ncbi:hypothetical protein I302_107542 [Kwoniella bestiolae CBS 10118]|uniref:Uncharacterized protein n=1 Tax=Kwoniella bestiolae CBS 10118 TaxID=1296100 RepID=A0A1B9FY82_9TREE|nr:hypothetical protein I302_06716 [Kwoniella bestiolae CBS 10118]OCF23733.1 hypothetical protein I302_06716 [Kwoniella bestiolae CBS 10118]